MEMAFTFTMGDNDIYDWSIGGAPEHEVSLSDYTIQVTEVSQGQFVDFLNEINGVSVAQCQGQACIDTEFSNITQFGLFNIFTNQTTYSYSATASDEPAMGVTVDGAQAYCDHIGQRLCTNAEWEYAARGDSSTSYSWGNSLYDNCNGSAFIFNGFFSYTTYYYQPRYLSDGTECTQWPDDVFSNNKNTQGVRNMSGNAYEIVSDYWDANYYCEGASANGNPNGDLTAVCQPDQAPWTSGTWSNPSGPTDFNAFDGEPLYVYKGGYHTIGGFLTLVLHNAPVRQPVPQNVSNMSNPGPYYDSEREMMGFRCCDDCSLFLGCP
jgi:formylglycine-generating enzyme required for sulfatase activity